MRAKISEIEHLLETTTVWLNPIQQFTPIWYFIGYAPKNTVHADPPSFVEVNTNQCSVFSEIVKIFDVPSFLMVGNNSKDGVSDTLFQTMSKVIVTKTKVGNDLWAFHYVHSSGADLFDISVS